ncbi:hypothetical protein FACS1894190_02050 [Spirochaetia bacterium]|nr:hypothetical protein FACS1894190_02050 [Spirochaetia bacterium]GHV21770.1 hypothetical protein FACS189494_07620 [Spirochaetia bacterium]
MDETPKKRTIDFLPVNLSNWYRMLVNYKKSRYGVSVKRKQTIYAIFFVVLLASAVVASVAFITIQKSRSSKTQKDIVALWKSNSYQEVFGVSSKALEAKPLDYFLLSIHGFSAYQVAIAQINNSDMLTYIDKCIFSLRKALLAKKNNVNNGRINYILGKAYYYKGGSYSDLAIKHLEAAKKTFKADDINEYLGLIYADLRDYRKSVDAFAASLLAGERANTGIENNANDILLLAIARSYIELEEEDTAQAYLLRCLDISRDYNVISSSRILLGNIYAKNGDLDEAEKQYISVLNESGEQANARFQLGELFALRGDSTRARAEWRKAVHIDPAYAPAIARLRM